MNKKLSIIILLSCVGNILSMNSFGSNRPSSRALFAGRIGINLILCEDWKGWHQLNTLFGVHARHTLPSVQAASTNCSVEPSNHPWASPDLLNLKENTLREAHGDFQSPLEPDSRLLLSLRLRSALERETANRAKKKVSIELDSAINEYSEARKTVQEFEKARNTNTTNGLSKETFESQFSKAQQIAAAAKQKALENSLKLKTANENVEKANGSNIEVYCRYLEVSQARITRRLYQNLTSLINN
jgi:hypothetical protein